MSYDISIINENGETMKTNRPHKLTGGRVRANENLEQIEIYDAELNVTYNYAKLYNIIWGHTLMEFDGKIAKDIIPKLEEGIEKLGTETYENYYIATPGNAGAALESLKFLCEQCPDGTIEIS